MGVRVRIGNGLAIVFVALLAGACQMPAQERAAMAVDHAASLEAPVEAFLDVWHTGNTDAVDTIVDASFERRAPADGALSGPEELKGLVTRFHTAFPDMRVIADQVYYLEDTAILHWTFTGTNTGPGDWEPTGKAVSVSGMTELRLSGGKVVLEDVYFDALGWMEQLGFSLAPPAG